VIAMFLSFRLTTMACFVINEKELKKRLGWCCPDRGKNHVSSQLLVIFNWNGEWKNEACVLSITSVYR
jgi:hypothetical protein